MAFIKIETVFNIELEFETADLPRRMVAYLIDFIILVSYFMIAKLAFYGDSGLGLKSYRGVMGLDILLISTPMLLYALISEITMHGQSVGKKLMGIRIISLDGKEPNVSQYLIRWIFRVFEWPFFFGYVFFSGGNLIAYIIITLFLGIGVIIPVAVSQKNQRLGDLAANTVVVRTQSDFSIDDTIFIPITDKNYAVSFPQVLRLSDRDINTITNILRGYSQKRNNDICTRLAMKVQSVLHIDTDMESVPFLRKLLSDYNYLANK